MNQNPALQFSAFLGIMLIIKRWETTSLMFQIGLTRVTLTRPATGTEPAASSYNLYTL